MAELGVWYGHTSQMILERHLEVHTTLVDAWASYPESIPVANKDMHKQSVMDHAYQTTLDKTSFARNRRRVLRLRTAEAALVVPDQEFDLVFIDADHIYEGCKRDIEDWYPKVRSGGWLGGHDYGREDEFPHYGVTKAVHEFCIKHDLLMSMDADYTWFVKKP